MVPFAENILDGELQKSQNYHVTAQFTCHYEGKVTAFVRRSNETVANRECHIEVRDNAAAGVYCSCELFSQYGLVCRHLYAFIASSKIRLPRSIADIVDPLHSVSVFCDAFEGIRISIPNLFRLEKIFIEVPPFYLQAGRPAPVAAGRPTKRRIRSRSETGPGKYSQLKHKKDYVCSSCGEKGSHNAKTCRKRSRTNAEDPKLNPVTPGHYAFTNVEVPPAYLHEESAQAITDLPGHVSSSGHPSCAALDKKVSSSVLETQESADHKPENVIAEAKFGSDFKSSILKYDTSIYSAKDILQSVTSGEAVAVREAISKSRKEKVSVNGSTYVEGIQTLRPKQWLSTAVVDVVVNALVESAWWVRNTMDFCISNCMFFMS